MLAHTVSRRWQAWRSRPQATRQLMRFVMGLGWGMVAGLALGFVLCWGVVERMSSPPALSRTGLASKPRPATPLAPTLVKAHNAP